MSETVFTPEIRAAHERVVAEFTLTVACPLVWYDRRAAWPKQVLGATCFFLRLDSGVVGVTADHVIGAFEAEMGANPQTVCSLRDVSGFDLISRIIDRDAAQDIATFCVSNSLLDDARLIPLDCRGDWPPPVPDRDRAVSLCGFPEALRRASAGGEVVFEAYGALAAVEDTTTRDLIVTYDPERDQATKWAPAKPPLGMNLSGCSGGPVMMHFTKRGLLRWLPVALIVAGPRGVGQGALAEADMIQLRRIHTIMHDGRIDKQPLGGWLPA